MNKIVEISKHFGKLVSVNSPVILTSFGVAGVLATTVLAVRGTFKAAEWISREASIRDLEDNEEEITLKEKVSLVWPAYIPAAAMGTVTIAAIVTSHHISMRRQAAIMSLYSITNEAFSEYKNKVVEKIGETKESAIQDELAKERLEKNPVADKTVIITGTGNSLCYDEHSGRYFESDIENIRASENALNSQIINQGYASLNDWYRLIGLAMLPTGEELGWNSDKLMTIRYTSHLTPNERPALSLGFHAEPLAKYYKAYY